jgi:hypothetical protein
MKDDKSPLQKRPASWIGIGLAIGAGVGVALDNIALGISIGMLIGAIISIQQSRSNDSEDPGD